MMNYILKGKRGRVGDDEHERSAQAKKSRSMLISALKKTTVINKPVSAPVPLPSHSTGIQGGRQGIFIYLFIYEA